MLTHGDGRILDANAAFVRLVERSPVNIYECFPATSIESLRAQPELRSDHPEFRVAAYECPLMGSAVPNTIAEVTVVRLPSSEGTVLQFILRDITERKQLESQVLRLQRIELLGQLASGVVHDVNGLLADIVSNAQLLEAECTAEIRDRARAVKQSAERASDLLRRILVFARGADPSLIPLDVLTVLRETAAVAGMLFEEKITFAVETEPDIPPILGDSNQFHQVIMNLCVNARDAMPLGGKLLLTGATVRLTAAEAQEVSADATPGKFVAISVRDTGTGIPLEIRGKLFSPFLSTKPSETSTGLGLATVLRVMRHHRGFVGYETLIGRGTCFTCYFPALPDPSLIS